MCIKKQIKMNIPANLKYTKDHEWVLVEGDIATVGITDFAQKELGDIVYVFSSDEYLLGVNQSFLNHDYYTDIITFDYTEGEFVSGDLFVSYERILDHVTLYDSTLKEEFLRVCVHGVLHLLGYKDKNDEEISLMRSKELFYISNYVSRET